ncbi:unnamed protein product [Allacma fusca]|uniref:Cytochrome P450 n=1 Tax=Allacma fusca TaxID=39272 RepID=A0A8J2KDH8_9HEXA|nr:unnamed protein product [Allacma fusca]
MFLTIVLGCVGVLAFLKVYFTWNSSYWKDRGVPEAKTENPLMKFIQMDFDFVKGDTQVYNQLKEKGFGGAMEFWNPVMFITDLDLMKNIYIKDFNSFVNRRGFDLKEIDPHMHYLLGNHNGEAWKGLRSKMTPSFSTGKMRRMFHLFDISSKKMITAIKKDICSDSQVELRNFVKKFTMDVIASAAFGVETNIYEDPNCLYAKMGTRIQAQFSKLSTVWKFFLLWLSPRLAKFLKVKITDDEADIFLSKVITESLNHRQTTGNRRDDFLQLMLEAKQGLLKDEEQQLDDDTKLKDTSSSTNVVFNDDVIIAQCFVFILGGFDTTEAMLSFAIYEIGISNEIQEKLYEEIKSAVEDTNGELSYDVVSNLQYLDMVISETLRKYPPISRTDRRSTQPYKIPGSDITLPNDSLVVIPIYQVHHDSQYWPEPDTFDPERFSKENISKRHPCAYQPFGQGPRNCIGNRFALLESKAVIAHLVLNFKLEPCDRTVIPIQFSCQGSIKPMDNICFDIKLRNSSVGTDN